MKKKTIAVSGGFDPLHKGHIELIRAAKKLGDYLIVIVNSDEFLKRKKGGCVISEMDRADILSELRCVDEVYLHRPTNPEDMSVIEALEAIKPDVFANGGDRESEKDIPEAEVCKRYGIEMVFNVGGGKYDSSSSIMKRSKEILDEKNSEERPWGSFRIITENDTSKSKILSVRPGGILSLQSHEKRNEHWVVVKGTPTITLEEKEFVAKENEHIYIPVGAKHRISNLSDKNVEIIEVQTGEYFGEDDIKRYQDMYKRI